MWMIVTYTFISAGHLRKRTASELYEHSQEYMTHLRQELPGLDKCASLLAAGFPKLSKPRKAHVGSQDQSDQHDARPT